MNSIDFEFPTSPDDLLYPAIFHNGKAYFLERGKKLQASVFGGPPPDVAITGISHGPRKLHHILSLGGDCFEPLWHVVGGHQLYLVFGMCFSGCQLTFKSMQYKGVEILDMTPTTSSPDWPYANYPDLLPYFILRLQACVDCTLEEFSRVSCQPLETAPNEAIVIVPPSPMYGMSLWGPAGDAEGVQIVFRCAMECDGIVRAYTQCG